MSYQINKNAIQNIINKLNLKSFSELADYAKEELYQIADNQLSLHDCDLLLAQAKKIQAKNSTQYRQQITRKAIPKQSTHLVATQLQTNFSNVKAQQQQYDEAMFYSNDFIPSRNTDFVNQGNVASMFSPAAYLVKLYREAKKLHPVTSPYFIDNRRPDLANLILSQENMDTPLSTLSLSNQVLAAQIGKKIGDNDKQKILAALAQDTLNPDGPYYYYTDVIQQVLQNHNVTLAQLIQPENRPANTNKTFILCTDLKISPPIYTLLTTEITPDNLNAEYQKVFGTIMPQTLTTANALAEHYHLPPEFFELLLPNKDDTEAQLKQHLLKVHKIVLLHKTTQLTPLTLSELMAEYSDNITDNTLVDILHIKQYEQFYNLEEQQARIWVGLKISQTAVNGQLSQYDQLFNNPPLYGQKFAPDDKEYDIAPNAQNAFKSNLKQAFGVNDQELYQIFLTYIYNEDDNNGNFCKNDITYTTAFYRFCLLATANKLTIAELAILFNLLDYHQLPTETFIDKLHTTVEWLNNQNLNVVSLIALTTENFNTNQSAEIENLIITLNSNLHDTKLSDNTLKQALAPFFASQLALSSADIAYQLLVWLDNIKTQLEDLDTNQFWQQISKIDIDKPFTVSKEAIRYCHRIAQLALITNLFKLSLAEVTLIVNQPDHLKRNLSQVYPTVENLQFITQFHNWTMQLMTQAPVVITTLSKDQLTVSMLAKAIKAPLDEFTAAAQQVDRQATSDTIITDVQHCLFIQQWYQAGETLAVDATVVGSLYDPSNNYPLSLSSLQLQTKLPFNQLKVGISNITKEYHKGNFYQAAVIDNNDDIELWDLMRLKIDPYYLYVEVYPLGNNQFRIVFQTEHPDSRNLGWGWFSVDKFQYLGNVKKIDDHPGEHFELTAYINWQEIQDSDMLTLVLCDNGDPITTISPVNFQRQDYPTQTFIDQLATELNIAIPTQPDLDPFLFSLATSLLNGLNKSQHNQVDGILAENLSSAQSYYYLEHIADNNLSLSNRDQLYSYLLIDNQDSYQVTTSQIAAAMASVQLYINRCIQQPEQEVGVNYSALQRPFFQEWEPYNRRYSSWAGIRELDYYPENYIDPTQRIGQTQMMNKLLQAINQSQLTSDIVEQAFHSYLTDFELVANLTMVSGYHDQLDFQTGFTYLIGASQEASPTYSWRKVNHDMFVNQGFPADAWTEWQAITASAKPYRNLIQPVIFKSRLYLFWLEQRQINSEKKDTPQKTRQETIPEYTYDLKHSHILYDGNWSTPFTYTSLNINAELLAFLNKDKPTIDDQVGLFVTYDLSQKNILVMLYQIKPAYQKDDIPITTAQAWNIENDFSLKNNNKVDEILKLVIRELDTTTALGVPAPLSYILQVPSNITDTIYSVAPAIPRGKAPLSMGLGQLTLTKKDAQYLLNGTIINITAEGQTKQYIDTNNNVLNTFFNKINQQYSPEELSQLLINLSYPKDEISLITAIFKKAQDYEIITYSYINKPELVAQDIYFLQSLTRNFNGEELPKITNIHSYEHYQTDTIPTENTKTLFEIFSTSSEGLFKLMDEPANMDLLQRPYKYSLRTVINGTPVEGPETTVELNKYIWVISLESYPWQMVLDQLATNPFIDITITVTDILGGSMGAVTHRIPIEEKTIDDTQPLLLKTASNKAQYMEGGLSDIYQSDKPEKHSGIYQVRLNTLFAKELTSRADRGLDTLLSLDTQYMPEPALPRTGVQVTLTLKPYDETINGSNKIFKLREADIWESNDSLLIYTGELSDQPTTVTCFLNRYNDAHGNKNNLYLEAEYQKGIQNRIRFIKPTDKQEWELDNTYNGGTFPGLASIDNVESFFTTEIDNKTEPMDFAGANALYFWELFYYVPMLVMKRLLQEQNFADSATWLKFIFSSAGYDRGRQNQFWNTRPLLEDTSWNEVPDNITDPDAIAQADPMHYKLSTLMNLIELLIARGDQDYRQLERDTLAEAKMWYVQAVELMGEDEPSLPTNWQNPSLEDAAELEEYVIFKPEKNTKWQELRLTLAQRLYNLRHNLTIDGKPLSLPLFASPANPADLLSAAVANAQGGIPLPTDITLGLYRFAQTLESAKGVVTQLTQYGNTLLGIIERQDAEKMAILLQTQGLALSKQSLEMQKTTQDELSEEKKALQIAITAAKERKDHYKALYDENINTGEQKVIDLHIAADTLMTTTKPIYMAAALANLAPNIFGLADGGMQYGAVPTAVALGIETAVNGILTSADKTTQSEIYRRRRQDWQQMYQTADYEEQQLTAQLAALEKRITAANQQYNYLETQQTNTLDQFNLLKNKFTNEALYNWLRGRLSAIYFQFYDLVIARCLRAQKAFQWETCNSSQFIKPGAWQSTYAGLLCGDALMLNLVTMEEAYLKWETRALDVDRTVSLAEFYQGMPGGFDLRETIRKLINGEISGPVGNDDNKVNLEQNILSATIKIADLKLHDDYPDALDLGDVRRIKQISVSLPALLGPYQDIQAVLEYTGTLQLSNGCKAIAISRGVNDSGQFQLDFNDSKYLPFEGIAIIDQGGLVLQFPNATENKKQKALLESLTDIILHIRYTIRKTANPQFSIV